MKDIILIFLAWLFIGVIIAVILFIVSMIGYYIYIYAVIVFKFWKGL